MSENPREPGSGSGKYRKLFELGQGGTANVSLAMAHGPEGDAQLLVVKQLRSVYAQEPEFRAMFMTEATLSARLSHPHVVRVFDVSEQGEVPTIAMEYIEGQTLDAVLGPGEPKLSLELHLRILADVLAGLHYSHELLDAEQAPLNVVHRDVSPHNVMVSYEGVVKVLDFGIAKLSGSTVETEAGVIKGKLSYMPPEQIAGQPVDRRADVFAVGVMLWEALSGAKLWKGLTDAVVMKRVLAGQIPSPENAQQDIAPELRAICVRALAPEREARYQTALELQHALEAFLAAQAPQATAAKLGEYMSERFASTRRAVRERIEGELSFAASSLPPPSTGQPNRSHTPSPTGYATSSRAHAEPQRSKVWLAALALVALGVAIIAWGMREREAGAPPVIAAGAPRWVNVSIEARPASASISIDGEQVGNPYVARRLFDARSRRVQVTAPGYAPEEIDVTFDTDVRMFRALGALPSVPTNAPSVTPPSKAPLAPRPAVAPPPVVPSAGPAPACDPPFSLDERGIKHFKAECL